MPDEGSFLQAILTNPTDDLPRLVYADWLDEQQTDEASRKAEFLRLTAALVMETKAATRFEMKQRLSELARPLPTDWLPVVSRLVVENCAVTSNALRRPLAQIEFEFDCPILWEAMTPTENPTVRHCESCKRHVYYCDTIGEVHRYARNGHCIAVDIALPRVEGDLEEPQWGRMRKGKVSAAQLERWREDRRRSELAERISAERERRKSEQ